MTTMGRVSVSRWSLGSPLAALAVAACSAASTPQVNGGALAAVRDTSPIDAPPDVAIDAPPDASIDAPPDGRPDASIDAPPAKLPDLPYTQLDKDERGLYMRDVVVPKMGGLFRGHDADKHAMFGCMSCHRNDGNWEMPNPGLPKLSPAVLKAAKPEQLAFMRKQVTPTMAKLVDKRVGDGDDPETFGCRGCHTVEDAPAGWKPR
jgi:hypothetical protein